MNNTEIIKRLNSSHDYFNSRKDKLFEKIEETKQNLEMIQTNIIEKEKYLDIQLKKEKDESNIFNLYNTTNKYAENIKELQSELVCIYKKKQDAEQMLILLEQELEEITRQIISNQIMKRHFIQEENRQIKSTQVVTEHTEQEEKIKHAQIQIDGDKFPRITTEDIIKRLQFCKEILDLDKTRCFLELNMLIEEISKEN